MNKVKSYCDNCIHKEVCGKEGCGDPAMTFCDDRITEAIPVEWLEKEAEDWEYHNELVAAVLKSIIKGRCWEKENEMR